MLGTHLAKQLNDRGPTDKWIDDRTRAIAMGRTRKVRQSLKIKKQAEKLFRKEVI